MIDDSELQYTGISHRVKLSEKPCAVKFVEKFDGFVVGTYDCMPDITSLKGRFPSLEEAEVAGIFEHTNHRIGSLNFLRHSSTSEDLLSSPQVVHRCEHGGIFDLSITAKHIIYAAHANGYVASYSFENLEFQPLISTKVTRNANALLTSIDTCDIQDRDGLILIGDSQGQMTLLDANLEKSIASCHVTDNEDPVWQVRFFPDRKMLENVLVLAAAEDSSWYIYKITSANRKTHFQRLYRNQDFKAGVTSICFIPTIENSDYLYNTLIGSYDESIRHYKMSIAKDGSEVQVQKALESPIVIAGGGIWRLNLVVKEYVYIAAMYAGTHRLEVASLLDQQRSQTIKCDNIIELDEVGDDDNNPAPLHYGVDLSPRDSLACIVDYNNNSCIFVKLAA